MNRQNSALKKKMIQALEISLGVVTTAAKKTGIDRNTHYNWLKSDEEYKEAVEKLEDVVLDFAESHLHQLIQDKNTAATIFLLKTKGKGRGYIEQSNIGITGDSSINITVSSEKAKQDMEDYLNDDSGS